MDSERCQRELSAILRREVSYLARRNSRWKEPIADVSQALRERNVRAVYFGGTPRALLMSRLMKMKFGRPRDFDIVVEDESVDWILEKTGSSMARKTRFGGVKFFRGGWSFDVWPLHRTWAFQHLGRWPVGFETLPFTTFFNLEAIAMDMNSHQGVARRIYSGDGQFFDGVCRRIIEVNLIENPFPELNVVRGIIFAANYDFTLGPVFCSLIHECRGVLTKSHVFDIQKTHYGVEKIDSLRIARWVEFVSDRWTEDYHSGVSLPIARQLLFWPDLEWNERIRRASMRPFSAK